MSNLAANLILRISTLGQGALRQVSSGLGQIGTSAGRAAQGIGRVGNLLSSMASGGHQLGANLNQISQAAQRVRDTLFQAVSAPIGAFSEFEMVMARVKGQMGRSSEGWDILNQKALEMGKTTRFSAVEVAGAFEEMTTLGFSAQQQMQMLDSVMNAASAGNMSMADAAGIAGAAIHQFGLSAEQVPHALDVIQVASSTSATDIRSMGETLKYVGPLAKAAGISLEDTATMAALLANSGIEASQAGTSLRGMLAAMGREAPRAKKELKGLGISGKELTAAMSDPVTMLQKMDEAMTEKGYTAAQRVKALIRVFGTESATGVATLMEKASQQGADGRTGWEAMRANIAQADGALKLFGATIDATTSSSLKKMGNQFREMLTEVGEKLAPVVGELGKKFPAILDRLKPKLLDMAKKIPEMLEKAPGVIDKVATAAGKLLDVIGGVVDLMAEHPNLGMAAIGAITFAPLLTSIGSVVAGLSSVIGLAGRAVAALTGIGAATTAAGAGAGAAGAAAGGGLLATLGPWILGGAAALGGGYLLGHLLGDLFDIDRPDTQFELNPIAVKKHKEEMERRKRYGYSPAGSGPLSNEAWKKAGGMAPSVPDATVGSYDPFSPIQPAYQGAVQLDLTPIKDLRAAAAELAQNTQQPIQIETTVKLEDNRTTTTTVTKRPRAGSKSAEFQ